MGSPGVGGAGRAAGIAGVVIRAAGAEAAVGRVVDAGAAADEGGGAFADCGGWNEAELCALRLGRFGAADEVGLASGGFTVVAVCAPGPDTVFSRVCDTAGMAGTVGLP